MILLNTEKSVQIPVVAILMGSISDVETMEPARQILKEFDIPCEMKVLSAHRTPEQTIAYVKSAKGRGTKIIIAGAGGAAHLPGIVAAVTTLPVIGIPIKSKSLNGMDSLLSIVQMPAGIPVATVAIDGAVNAALLAVEMLALASQELATKLEIYRTKLQEKVLKSSV
ncbi:MAG: 5-(carboxyamino)imidazole ribonucleotide mutase [Bacteroidota bacterium]|jgi:phosphoribosylaminoimidazole carboxylase PurE protein